MNRNTLAFATWLEGQEPQLAVVHSLLRECHVYHVVGLSDIEMKRQGERSQGREDSWKKCYDAEHLSFM